jgi:hypothetical protein
MARLPPLPIASDPLDGLTIATPCQVPWESLAGDDRVRHCGRCRQNVYNLESFSRAEALRLLRAREGRRVCVRLFRRDDGTVVTADCWARLRAARRRGLWAFALALVVVGWAQLCAMAVGLHGLRHLVGRRTMGELPVAVTRDPVRTPRPQPPDADPPVRHVMGAPPPLPPPPPPPPKLMYPVMGRESSRPPGSRG